MRHRNLRYKCLEGSWIQTSGSWKTPASEFRIYQGYRPIICSCCCTCAGDIKRLNGMRCHYQQGNNTPFSLPRLNGSHPSLPLPACRQFTYHHSPRCIPHNNPWIQHTHSNTATHTGLPFSLFWVPDTPQVHSHMAHTPAFWPKLPQLQLQYWCTCGQREWCGKKWSLYHQYCSALLC